MARRRLDRYYSPEWAGQDLYRRVPQIHDVAEPCVGKGALINGRTDVAWTNDLDTSVEASHYLDASLPASWARFPPAAWVVTNPPFSEALPIWLCAMSHALDGVALLLRLSYLEPTLERSPYLTERPPDRMIVLPRISFTGDGATDSVTVAWLIWARQPGKFGRGIEVVPNPKIRRSP